MEDSSSTNEHIYFVKGMHCSSCELIVEKKLLEIENIKSVEASTSKGRVLIEYEGDKPSINQLDRLFQKEGYVFSEQPFKKEKQLSKKTSIILIIGVPLSVVGLFLVLTKLSFSGIIRVNAKSSLPLFLILGIIAGFSSCAALVGGIVLSMSKQWSDLYSKESSLKKKFEPHILFNSGRIISYAAVGALLGGLGSVLKFSTSFFSILVIVISIVMILLGLQMLGVKFLQKFQITAPKFMTRYVAKESNFKGRFLPFLIGAFTVILPCGFTITVQGLAILSGNALQGSLMMLFFALGTLPMLLIIGFSSVKFLEKPYLSSIFLKIAGILVLLFTVYNVSSQFNVLGLPSLSNIVSNQSTNKSQNNDPNKGLPTIVDGKQVIKMEASSSGYNPNYFKVRVGVPVKWEIVDTGAISCTSAIISKGLFDDQIALTPDQTSFKEFTPQKAGTYKFSCWMGMVTGTIDVIDAKNYQSDSNATTPVSSGAGSGCCGSSSGGCCSSGQ